MLRCNTSTEKMVQDQTTKKNPNAFTFRSHRLRMLHGAMLIVFIYVLLHLFRFAIMFPECAQRCDEKHKPRIAAMCVSFFSSILFISSFVVGFFFVSSAGHQDSWWFVLRTLLPINMHPQNESVVWKIKLIFMIRNVDSWLFSLILCFLFSTRTHMKKCSVCV